MSHSAPGTERDQQFSLGLGGSAQNDQAWTQSLSRKRKFRERKNNFR
jgi:hypothetical protein